MPMRMTIITKIQPASAKKLHLEKKTNDFILTPGRYVGIKEAEDDGEPFEEKMKRLTSELSEQMKKSAELDIEIKKVLGEIGYEI